MTKQVYIHAGAHRTGSSSFQLCLSQNRDLLSALGYDLAYPGRDGAPGGQLKLRFASPRENPARREMKSQWAAKHLAALSPDPERPLILSEENLPGRMFHLLKGQLYPGVEERLNMIREVFAGASIRVLIVIRDYAGFLESAYRKRSELVEVAPFRDLAPAMTAIEGGWPDLIAGIQDHLRPERLTVVDYAQRGENRALLARLVPDLAGQDLREPDRAVNLSAPGAALEELQARLAGGGRVSAAERGEVIARHAGADPTGDRFTDGERRTLQARYAADLKTIAAMPGVELAGRPETGAPTRTAKRVFLHAGSHRTGTSSFQSCLNLNRQGLSAAGIDVAYPGRDGVPGGRLGMRLPRPGMMATDSGKFIGSVRDAVRLLSPDRGRAVVLSEENIPGRMIHFYKGQFFPASEQRFRAMRAGLGDAELHLLYVVRSYDELYVSAYRKRAEDRPMRAFSELVEHFLNMDRGWPELLAQMRDELRPVRFVVVPYERRGASRDLLRALLPPSVTVDLQEPERDLNVSATDAALMALQRRYHAGETLSRVEWKTVMADHASDRDPRGFAGFGAADRKVLKDRYAADLDRVAALEQVEVL